MIDKTENPAEIYLITDSEGDLVWSDTPAPGEGMCEEDATRYLREDLAPESNELLARRVVELTNERDTALSQLTEVQNNCTGKAPCERFCEALATKKMFENLRLERDAALAQVEQLKPLARRCLWGAVNWNDHNFEPLHKYCRKSAADAGVFTVDQANALLEQTPAQCLAEIKAKAVEAVRDHYKNKFPAAEKFTAAWIIEGLEQYANQLRQQAKELK